MERNKSVITLEELGVNLEKMNLEIGIDVPICNDCGNMKPLMGLYFDGITEFIENICEEIENCVCLVILQDESYICGAKINGRMYRIGNDVLTYKDVIPEIIEQYPNIKELVVIQHVSTMNGMCYFEVITE